MTFSDANFEFNSDVFKPGDAFQIWADSVQTYFNIYPDKSLKIIGHTDYYGSNQYNQGLGARRAVAAKAYFEKKGLKASIVTSSNGEKTPIANNATEIGRQKNRRVQFIIE
jgi:outer membrane protein OmpA-like peptidoglycan-associated protein